MTVKIRKPEINIRQKLSEAHKPSGVAGEAMLRAETVAEQQALLGVGRRNMIINGDFKVSQRGTYTTAFEINGAKTYYVDRWYSTAAGTVNMTHKLDQTLPNGVVTNSVRFEQITTGYVGFGQFIEINNQMLNVPITLSLWIKTNYKPGVSIFHYTSSQPFAPFDIIPDGEWHKYTWTTTFSQVNTMRPEIWSNTASSAAGNYFETAQWQLEIGTVATPFEYRSYGEELALCQRYFQTLSWGAYRGIGFAGSDFGSNSAKGHIAILPVTMVSDPTVTIASGSVGALFNIGLETTVTGGTYEFLVQGKSNLLWGVGNLTEATEFYWAETGSSGLTLHIDAEL